MRLKPPRGSNLIFFNPEIKGSTSLLILSTAPMEKELDQPQDGKRNGPRGAVSLSLTLSADSIFHFFPLLQRGVRVKVQLGCSIKTLLVEQLGLAPEYIGERVRIVFLDGKPVDDLEKALVKNGSILALSSAMPGLAGASLRRDSPFTSFRREISHQENEAAIPCQEGFIWVKLFNFLIPEMGPAFLKRGILLCPEDFKEFWQSLPQEFWRGMKPAIMDGQEMEVSRPLDLGGCFQDRWVFLSIHFDA